MMMLRKFSDFNFSVLFNPIQSQQTLVPSETIEYDYEVQNLRNITRSNTPHLANSTRPYLMFMFGRSQTYACLHFISLTLHANLVVNVTIENESNQTKSNPAS